MLKAIIKPKTAVISTWRGDADVEAMEVVEAVDAEGVGASIFVQLPLSQASWQF